MAGTGERGHDESSGSESDTKNFCSFFVAKTSHVTTLNFKGAREIQSDHEPRGRTGNIRGTALIPFIGSPGRESSLPDENIWMGFQNRVVFDLGLEG